VKQPVNIVRAKGKNKANGMILFILACGSGFFVLAQGFRHLLGHFGGEHISLVRRHFTAVREARMADGENPKEGGDPDADYRQHAEQCDAVKDGIEDEAAPSLAGDKIDWWDEDEAEVDHMLFGYGLVGQQNEPAEYRASFSNTDNSRQDFCLCLAD
jgi:hypothetical protein